MLMAGTGVAMLFEWNDGLTTVVHQWFSWLFLAGAGGLIALNFRPIEQALVDAPLWALAGTTHTSPQVLVARLKAQSIAANSQQSMRELSSSSGVGENRLPAVVFLPQ